MTLEEKNKALFIKKYNVDIVSIASENNKEKKTDSDSSCIVENTASSGPTLKKGSRYIHSKYDPSGEAEKIVSAVNDEGYDCWVFGGMGLGYFLESFLEKNKNATAVVVEPDLEIFLSAVRSRDLEKCIDPQRVIFVIGSPPESVIPFLNTLQCERIKYFQVRSEYMLDSSYYEELKTCVSSYVSRKEINNNTLKKFGKAWVKNLAENLALFSVSPGITHLENIFSGIPALIAAGGPGLDEALPYFKDLRERFVFIAVDTSLSACLRAGIEPDFIVVVDPQYWNSRHLDRCSTEVSILVSEPSTCSRVFKIFSRNIIFASSVFPLGQYVENLTFQRGKIGAGGSVATSAFDLARQMGCSEIIFAGLDLCYPGKQTHFKGSFFEERAHTFSSRLKPASDMDFSLLTDASLIKDINNNEEPVFTDRRLIIYKKWFEEQLQIHNTLKTGTLSINGIKINGIPHVAFDDVLNYPASREKINTIISGMRNLIDEFRKKSGRTNLNKTEEGILGLISILSALKSTAMEGVELTEKILSNPEIKSAEIENTLTGLDKIDEAIMAGETRHIAGFLLQDITRKITAGTGGSTLAETVKNSYEIYSSLAESISFHEKKLVKSLKQLKASTVCLPKTVRNR